MKKEMIIAGLLLLTATANAQERRQPPSMEDKLKHTNAFFKKEVGIADSKQKAVAEVFKNFFIAEDKVRKDNPPPPPPAKVKSAMDKLKQDRDAQLKQVLTADEFARFKAKEKQMQPPPPPGANGNKMPPPQQN